MHPSENGESSDDMDAFLDEFEHSPLPDPLSLAQLEKALRVVADGVLPVAPPKVKSALKRDLKLGYPDDLVTRDMQETSCETLFVSFCSLTESGHRQQEFCGTAKRAGVSHALFLCDPLQAWFLRADTAFASVLSLILCEIERLKPSRVVCVGASMGGYAAIRCGVALARRHSTEASAPAPDRLKSVVVIAFGPQVFIDPSERAAIGLPPMPFNPALDRLHFAARDLNLPLHSLVHLISDAQLGIPLGGPHALVELHVEMHVGELAGSDVREARLLELAISQAQRAEQSVPHVERQATSWTVAVHVHQGSGHTIAADLKSRGQLDTIVRAHV